jgi:O-antigen/teichoic acid export membrane protein
VPSDSNGDDVERVGGDEVEATGPALLATRIGRYDQEGPQPGTDELIASAVEPRLSGEDVRRRAKSGAAILAARGVALRAVGFGGNIALARLLLPEDFGLVAFGITLMTLVTFLGDGGIGAALVRRERVPEIRDLQAVMALQALISLPVALLTAITAIPFGGAAAVTAVMVASLPVVALKTPGNVLLERRLEYGRLAVVDIAETIVYFAYAVIAVALGAGVWGLATATVVRALAGAGTMAAVSPVGVLVPRWSAERLRPLFGFGARFQAAQLANFARDHGINIGTAAIAGLSTLGVWSLAGRVMQIPFLLFQSLGTVAFPAMSRLRDAGEDLRPTLERGLRQMAIGTGFVLTPLMAAAPALITSVFGVQWANGADIVPIAGVGLLISGPMSVATVGFLYAIDDARTPLRSLIANAVVYLGVALPLLPLWGVNALALGWMCGSLSEAAVLARGAARACGVRGFRTVAAPAVLAMIVGLAGNGLVRTMPPTLLTTACAAASALVAYAAVLAVVDHAALRRFVGAFSETAAPLLRVATRSRAYE